MSIIFLQMESILTFSGHLPKVINYLPLIANNLKLNSANFTFSDQWVEGRTSSAGLQERLVGLGQDLVADLGVGDGAVFLAQVKAQLTLVAEVKVTLLALENNEVHRLEKKQMIRYSLIFICFFFIFFQCVCDSQCKASLRCECAGGSSGSAGGGSGCHRCGKGTASPRYGSERGPWGGQPKARTNSHSQVKICNKKKKMSVSTLRHDRLMPCVRYDMCNINQCFPNPKMALCFVHNPKIVYCPRGAKKDEKYSRLEAFFQKITQTDESTIKIAGD